MTGDGKLLKITCLGAMFCGLVSIGLGVFLALGNMADIDAWTTVGEGAISTVFGVRTAILANVPSNTQKIGKKALALLLGAVGVLLLFFTMKTFDVTVAQLALAGVVLVLAVVAWLLAHRIVKEQMRK